MESMFIQNLFDSIFLVVRIRKFKFIKCWRMQIICKLAEMLVLSQTASFLTHRYFVDATLVRNASKSDYAGTEGSPILHSLSHAVLHAWLETPLKVRVMMVPLTPSVCCISGKTHHHPHASECAGAAGPKALHCTATLHLTTPVSCATLALETDPPLHDAQTWLLLCRNGYPKCRSPLSISLPHQISFLIVYFHHKLNYSNC